MDGLENSLLVEKSLQVGVLYLSIFYDILSEGQTGMYRKNRPINGLPACLFTKIYVVVIVMVFINHFFVLYLDLLLPWQITLRMIIIE
jgi:hypothetical protein